MRPALLAPLHQTWGAESFVLKKVGECGPELRFATKELQENRDVVLAAVRQSGLALEFAGNSLRADPTIVLEAVRQNGVALQFAAEALCNDRAIVLEAVQQSGWALEFAATTLRGDRELVLKAVRRRGRALRFAAKTLRNDQEVVLSAVQQRNSALEFASSELRRDRNFVFRALYGVLPTDPLGLLASEKVPESMNVCPRHVHNPRVDVQLIHTHGPGLNTEIVDSSPIGAESGESVVGARGQPSAGYVQDGIDQCNSSIANASKEIRVEADKMNNGYVDSENHAGRSQSKNRNVTKTDEEEAKMEARHEAMAKEEGAKPKEAENTAANPKVNVDEANLVGQWCRIGACGLYNLGNSCYMNSILQALAKTVPLWEYLVSDSFQNDISNTPSDRNSRLVRAVAELFKNMSGNTPISPDKVRDAFGEKHNDVKWDEQQDAQEFLTLLLGDLHEAVSSAPHSKISELFDFQVNSACILPDVGERSSTSETYMQLPLLIPRMNHASIPSIEDCIDLFTQTEEMNREDWVVSSGTKKQERTQKELQLLTGPRCLVIHLRRFSSSSDECAKIETLVRAPLVLELSRWIRDPFTPYKLRAVVNHDGTLTSGHYTASCLIGNCAGEERWHNFDDHRVTEIQADAVVTRAAYLLVYEGVKTTATLVKEAEKETKEFESAKDGRLNSEQEVNQASIKTDEVISAEEAVLSDDKKVWVKTEDNGRIRIEEEAAKADAAHEARSHAEKKMRDKAAVEVKMNILEGIMAKAKQEIRLKADAAARLKAEENERLKAHEEARIRAEEAAVKAVRAEQNQMLLNSMLAGGDNPQLERVLLAGSDHPQVDHVINTPELLELCARKNFQRMSVDKTGVLRIKELKSLIQHLYAELGLKMPVGTGDWNAVARRHMSRFDKNRNGGLDSGEFRELYRWLLWRKHEQLNPPVFKRENVIGDRRGGAPYQFYNVGQQLGAGAFGIVYQATALDLGIERVMKTVNVQKATMNGVPLALLEHEIDILVKLDHPNIIRFVEWFRDSANIYIIMDVCAGGELSDFINERASKQQPVAESFVVRIFYQILEAISYCHGKGVMHKDLKLQNVMLRSKLTTKSRPEDVHIIVLDVGLAELFGHQHNREYRSKTAAGTLSTMAPEVLMHDFSNKCDIWSIGCMMFAFFNCSPQLVADDKGREFYYAYPFFPNQKEDEQATVQAFYEQQREGPPLDRLQGARSEAKHVVKLMLSFDERRRPDALSIMQMEFFTEALPTSADVVFSHEQIQALTRDHEHRRWWRATAMQAAARLPVTKLEQMRKWFDKMDANHDGCLSVDELLNALERFGVSHQLAENAVAALRDGQGDHLEWTEFVSWCLPTSHELFAMSLQVAFQALDTNRNGSLERDEIYQLLSCEKVDRMHMPASKKVDDMVAELDFNSDGRISFPEFHHYFINVDAS